ncbi:MAG TPA: hypothetical protein VJ032_03935 [Thermoanaerobaculia bacterium]|nr:hypothetical protein [Thermoanaerobaculia bacterium]
MKARFLLIAALALVPLVANAGEGKTCNKSTKSCPAKSSAECKKDKKDCSKEKCAQDGTCQKSKSS